MKSMVLGIMSSGLHAIPILASGSGSGACEM
jgi:hypothetical protein